MLGTEVRDGELPPKCPMGKDGRLGPAPIVPTVIVFSFRSLYTHVAQMPKEGLSITIVFLIGTISTITIGTHNH